MDYANILLLIAGPDSGLLAKNITVAVFVNGIESMLDFYLLRLMEEFRNEVFTMLARLKRRTHYLEVTHSHRSDQPALGKFPWMTNGLSMGGELQTMLENHDHGKNDTRFGYNGVEVQPRIPTITSE